MEENLNSTNVPPMNESNPLAANLHVRLSMPESFEIEIVEASQFREYELWALVSSIMLNLSIGFIVAAATNDVPERCSLLWITSAIFIVLFLSASLLTAKYRKKIKREKQIVKMVASQEQ